MKKMFLGLMVLFLIFFIGCGSDDSSGPNLYDEQIAYIFLMQDYNTTSEIYEIDGLWGMIPDMNTLIEGDNYKIFNYEFNEFRKYYEFVSGLSIDSSDWTSTEYNNVNSAFKNSSTISIEINTNIGKLAGEVDKITSVAENVLVNGSSPASLTLNKNSDMTVTWDYSFSPPEYVYLYIYYDWWNDDGSANYENITLVETILNGSTESYTVSGDLLNEDGYVTIRITPINGSIVLSGEEIVSRTPNLTGDGSGYFFTMGDTYHINDITVGNYPITSLVDSHNLDEVNAKNSFIEMIINNLNYR
ncbi:MAG: hypothetical protein FXF47_09070 [Candidatus Mcinerneyibacterium aminivorans]|uniref:Fibronectin type III domain-containing protein n=1 Tax=Candidatus Mcinerneyibacterium aminivorans TaxID=2703815 RepID=A0A5D0M9M0_9BACT|nr:MAG: hypothetical protein FXF47_09070 [Candidatus Mcinerneyibacterium aminivorans]